LKALTKVVIKVFLPNNKFSRTVVHTAPRGTRFTGNAVCGLLETLVDKMQQAYPGTKYKYVALKGQQFNVVCTERSVPLYAPPQEETESAGTAH